MPAARSTPEALDETARLVAASQARLFYDEHPVGTAILDGARQIVYANKAFEELVGRSGADFLSDRPGEALGCELRPEGPGGCGTGRACLSCGAARVLEASLRGGSRGAECLLSRRLPDGSCRSCELQVWARPIEIGGRDLILLAAMDIAAQKRRDVFERVFYHDILNTAMGIEGLVGLAGEQGCEGRLVPLRAAARQLLEEIASQRELKAGEEGSLELNLEVVDSRTVLEDALALLAYFRLSHQVEVVVDPGSARLALRTDPVLLRRILGNMVKNALEASVPGQTVGLGCSSEAGRAVFWVRNPGFIPEEAQERVFQRSFSTKGRGRGLGTYSMRLLGETYLGGIVSFSSSEGEGTVFRFSLPLD